ncbi:MAG: 5-oxoprolinase subunit PxpB [Firmicutes bacterium]|nr:5-oxoprolinase subunit PxpB [Bacillota bacterium]
MEKYKLTLVDAGDSAVSIRFPEEISEQVNREVIYYLDCIKSEMAEGKLSGVFDVIPSYAAILLCFDPLVTDGETIKNEVEEIILNNFSKELLSHDKNIIEIPVMYGGEYGPDLENVSKHTGLSQEEIIKLHSEPLYPVYMIGFLAGFPYLGGMNPSIATPRLDTPRLSVPEGSVGIAGLQTGIYPIDSPGGWQIIGRTPIKLYDPESSSPFLLSPGDHIKFIPIDKAAFDSYMPLNDASLDSREKQAAKTKPGEASIRIASSGPLTTIQDLGRRGYMDKGLSICGAIDKLELSRLNVMLGNEPWEAGLEATFITPRIEFLKDTVFAVSGFDYPIKAKAGDVFESFTMPHGIRTYFAFAGGIDVKPVLGSKSTDIKNGIGGLNGKKLASGDELIISDAAPTDFSDVKPISDISIKAFSDESPITLYITSGPQYSDISEDGIKSFLNSEYKVSSSSDRMGIRFDGPSLSFTSGKDGNILTDGLAPGAIQITPSGQPILMNVDAQTTGGYSKPFYLASISKQKVAQLRPGDKVKFVLIKTADAVSLYREEFSSIFSK